MSRLSFRPRPVDFLKKLPLLKSVKDFEDEETPTSTRNCQLLRFAAEADNEAHHIPTKKVASEIPIPESVTVDTYRIDYSPTFIQPTSYLRGRGACAKLGEFVEYDLDNEDEDWLEELNKERRILSAEMFEALLYKLEVLDHKARERAGVITPTLGSPIPVLLQVDAAIEALQSQSIQYGIFQTVYNYWKQKRELWQKPILRHLQPPPPVTDTNPYNVFRPREKAHRLHTRRMQRRENNVQSFDKLRQVRRNLDQAKFLLEALIKREEKKRDVMESEVSLQNIQLKYKHETELLEDSLAVTGFTTNTCKFGSSEEDSDEIENTRPAPLQNPHFSEYSVGMANAENTKQELRRQNAQQQQGWLHKVDPLEPVLMFSKPLVPEKLGAAGIVAPVDSSGRNGRFNGRMGRGGRIVFDRWNPFSHTSIDLANPSYVPPKPQPSTCN